MEFRISKTAFLRALQTAQGIADRRATMPILGNVLLRTEGKTKLLCAATDLSVAATMEVEANIKREGGITVGARHLHDIVKGLPGDDLHVKKLENQRAEIRAGKVEFRVVGLPDKDFPRLPDPREVKMVAIEAGSLRDMLSRTVYASSSDETRPHLSGVLLEAAGEKARMVATDGHRLARVEREWRGEGISPPVLVPRRGVLEIKRLLEGLSANTTSVGIGLHQGSIFVRAGDAVVSVKLSDAQFPPYEKVVPSENDKDLVLNRLAFLEALRRVSLVASDRTWAVRLELEGEELKLSSENPDLGDAKETLEVAYKGKGLSIGFNARYLIEALEAFSSEQVHLELGAELEAALLRPAANDETIAVVMPMRI